MKIRRMVCGLLASLGAAALVRAQPEVDLRQAVERLIGAGNYSWDESRGMYFDPLRRSARLRPTGTGETIVGGYTTAIFQRRHVVLRGQEAVLEMKGGWRHAADLTDEEVAELGRLQMSSSSAASAVGRDADIVPSARAKEAAATRAHRYTHVLPHEMLQFFLKIGTNYRKAGGAILADVAVTPWAVSELESYVMTGALPKGRPTGAGLLGMPRPVSSLDRTLPPEERAILYVTLNAGAIEEFTVEFTRVINLSLNGAPPERGPTTSVYTTKLSKIGQTTVDVSLEVKALFLDVPGNP